MNLRLLSFLFVPAALVGCDLPEGGDRADTGKCPSGESCSDRTPGGLYFGGAPLGDSIFNTVTAPRPTVAGGTQTITLYVDEYANQQMLAPFAADTSGDALVIESVTPPVVRIRGGNAGEAHLRIVDPETGELYDRLTLSTVAGASVQLRAFWWGLFDREVFEGAPFALWAGSDETHLVVALVAGGERVVDQSLRIGLPAGWVTRPGTWDTFTTAPAQVGTYDVEVELGGHAPVVRSVRAVDRVDDIVWVDAPLGSDEPLDTLVVDTDDLFCFRAVNDGEAVVGAPFEFSSTGPISVYQYSVPGSCPSIRGLQPGAATVTVSVGETSRTFSLTVVTPARVGTGDSAPGQAGDAVEAVGAAAPGERAARAANLAGVGELEQMASETR